MLARAIAPDRPVAAPEPVRVRAAAHAPTPAAPAVRTPPRSLGDYAAAHASATARVATGAGVIQCYTRERGRKVSEHANYLTDETGEIMVRPGDAVERSHDTHRTRRYRGVTYEIWEPDFDVIGDCVAAAEELMHGKQLKYGAPGISHFLDAPGKPEFGASDADNRKHGKASDLGDTASPAIGQAYVIVRQGFKRREARPQMHGATVVARDGIDNVTLETSAPLVGAVGANRVTPIYDMYESLVRRRRRAATFKTTYEGEYGADATVSVIAPTKPLKAAAKDTRPGVRWKPY